jgi:hypothetical protein
MQSLQGPGAEKGDEAKTANDGDRPWSAKEGASASSTIDADQDIAAHASSSEGSELLHETNGRHSRVRFESSDVQSSNSDDEGASELSEQHVHRGNAGGNQQGDVESGDEGSVASEHSLTPSEEAAYHRAFNDYEGSERYRAHLRERFLGEDVSEDEETGFDYDDQEEGGEYDQHRGYYEDTVGFEDDLHYQSAVSLTPSEENECIRNFSQRCRAYTQDADAESLTPSEEAAYFRANALPLQDEYRDGEYDSEHGEEPYGDADNEEQQDADTDAQSAPYIDADYWNSSQPVERRGYSEYVGQEHPLYHIQEGSEESLSESGAEDHYAPDIELASPDESSGVDSN